MALAGTEADGLFRSDDGGQSWEPVPALPGTVRHQLRGAPATVGSSLPGPAAGVALSFDGGHTWSLEAPDLGPILSLASRDGAILAGTDQRRRSHRAAPDQPGGSPTTDSPARDGRVWPLSRRSGEEPLLAVASLDARRPGSPTTRAPPGRPGGWLSDLAATSVAFVQPPTGDPVLLATFESGLFQSTDIVAGWQPVAAGRGRVTMVRALGDTATAASSALAAGPSGIWLTVKDGGRGWRRRAAPERWLLLRQRRRRT